MNTKRSGAEGGSGIAPSAPGPATRRKILRFSLSVAVVAAILAVYRVLLQVNNTTVALTLLLAILAVSTQWGLAEAMVASVVAVLGFNFYFLPPVGTLTIQDSQNWVAFVAFLVTAVTASQLSAHARRRTAEAETRRIEVERLYQLVQGTMLTGNPRKAIRDFLQKVLQVYGCEGAAFYYRPTEEIFRTGPESAPASDHDLRAAAELDDIGGDEARAVAIAPVRLGVRPLGSVALLGTLPPKPSIRAIVNLLAITIEKARALEEAGHADAERQNEMLKSALLDALAHDFKTPLTSIKAAVTSLLGSSEPEKRELLTIINEEADRLNELVVQVIAMARIEAGKLHLEKQAIAPAELIAGVTAEFAAALKERPVTIEVPADLPAAEGDADFVQQVIKQFLENALKYSPPGAPIAISARRKGAKIVIGVADRGPGIEENERARIFDKFFRGREHRFRTQGTGMGLAIAKGIVEAHGERIWVESERGQGSAFYFSLPLAGGREN
jgi:two-component system, OmpR family, sensor histidine kinase KdpD